MSDSTDHTNYSDRLDPCPMCGGEANILTLPEGKDHAGSMYVQCMNFSCMMRSTLAYPSEDDPTPWLIRSWNRRFKTVPVLTTEQKPVAQVVSVDPPGPDGHGVNWLKGKRLNPGDLLYTHPTSSLLELQNTVRRMPPALTMDTGAEFVRKSDMLLEIDRSMHD